MKTLSRTLSYRLFGLSLIVSLFYSAPSYAKTANELNAEVDFCLKLFTQQVKGGKRFLDNAKGVLVIPNIIKAGLVVGGEYGEGALRIEGKTVNFYSLAAGSIGLQIGAQKRHLILVFLQEGALNQFQRSSGWKAGVDGSVAFIDKGAAAATDTTTVKHPIVGFVFGQQGLMAGATIEGAKFTKVVR